MQDPTEELSRPQERRSGRARWRSVRPLVITWLIAGALLGVVVGQSSVPSDDLFLDSNAVSGVGWYVGLVTSLGVVAWTVSVGGCVATAFVAHLGHRMKAASAFRGAALLFAVLLFDDLFLLHSNLLPQITGVPKLGFLAFEGALAAMWLLPAVPELRRTRWVLLLCALSAFALSLAVDVLHKKQTGMWLLAEDGPKFLGVVALATWSVMTAADVIRSVVEAGRRNVAENERERELATR